VWIDNIVSAGKIVSKSIKKECPGSTEWRNEKGQWHREDGPAVEWSNGDEEWYINDKLHRINGPAVDFEKSDYTEWWVNDVQIKIY
jgi:hypothetical protein